MKGLLKLVRLAEHLLSRDVNVGNAGLRGGCFSQHGDAHSQRPPYKHTRRDGEVVLRQLLLLLKRKAYHLLYVLLRSLQATDIVPGHGGILDFVVDAVEFAMQENSFQELERRTQDAEHRIFLNRKLPVSKDKPGNKLPFSLSSVFCVLFSAFYIQCSNA